MIVTDNNTAQSIPARLKAILVNPKSEWQVIAERPETVTGLFKHWVLPVAAVPAVAGLVGSLVFGFSALGVQYRPSPLTAISEAVVIYVLSLIQVGLLALIIDALAPLFGAARNRNQAFKVAAYSMSAGWAAGILQLVPNLSMLAILGALYGIYLLYLGLPVLMKSPQERSLSYIVTTILAAIVLGLLANLAALPLATAFGAPSAAEMSIQEQNSATANLQDASEAMTKIANGEGGKPVPIGTLASLLPKSIGSAARGSLVSLGPSPGSFNGAHASAHYGPVDGGLDLTITDLGAAGAVAGMGANFTANNGSEDGSSAEILQTGPYGFSHESWDEQARLGSYSKTVANRFLVQASGGPTLNDLRVAVEAVDQAKLKALAQ